MKSNHTMIIISEADNHQKAAVGPFPVVGDCCLKAREGAKEGVLLYPKCRPTPTPCTPLIRFMLTVKAY